MKNTKAIFLIVLGSFILATGFAFAENVAYEQLKNGFDKSALQDLPAVNVPAVAAANDALPVVYTEVAPATRASIPAVAAAPAPEPKPTAGEKIKKFLGGQKRNILAGGIGAYLGYALIGTVAGALTGGLFIIALMLLASL